MNTLFERFKRVLDEERIHLREKQLRGECFNVFEVLGLTTNETRTHSAFIAELLHPNGSHGLGSIPLSLFLKLINNRVCKFDFNLENVKISTEKSIGNITSERDDGGRIDILLESEGKAIIIENKIYAGDQEKQLIRYYKYAIKEYGEGNFVLLYLCLESHEASDYSAKSEQISIVSGKDYYSVSYNTEIQLWIKDCLSASYNKPLIRETLQQYLSLILNLTNNMEKTNDEIIGMMRDNPSVITKILKLQDAYKQSVIDKELKEGFEAYAKKQNLELIIEPGFLVGARYSKLTFRKKEWKRAVISILPDNKQSNYWIAIFLKNYNRDQSDIELRPLSVLPDGIGPSYPLGSKWLPGVYRWIYDAQTIEDIISGKFFDVIEALINEIIAEAEAIPGFSDL